MSKVIILGSSNAISTQGHENTHMVIVGDERVALVDCPANPIVRLEQAGLSFNDLTDIILTHFHPDHVSGLALMLMDMWLRGRTTPVNIYGLHYTLDRVELMMNLYSWENWPDFFPVIFHRLPDSEGVTLLDCADFKITSSPARHLIPSIALRFDFHSTGKAMAYSCDTEPCPQVVRLADGVDILIHEASGASVGHSSAAQAGEVAAQAEVAALYLIHYPTGRYSDGDPLKEAAEKYQGQICLATDLMILEL